MTPWWTLHYVLLCDNTRKWELLWRLALRLYAMKAQGSRSSKQIRLIWQSLGLLRRYLGSEANVALVRLFFHENCYYSSVIWQCAGVSSLLLLASWSLPRDGCGTQMFCRGWICDRAADRLRGKEAYTHAKCRFVCSVFLFFCFLKKAKL